MSNVAASESENTARDFGAGCGLDETTEETEGAQRVLFLGRARFHLSRSIRVFRDSRFFNHG